MDHTANNPLTSPASSSALMFVLLAVGIGYAFFLTEHHLTSSKMEAFGTTAEKLETVATGEQMKNLVGFSIIAAVGAFCVIYPARRRFGGVTLLGCLMVVFLLWCAASYLWATDSWVTTKRVVILLLCFVGALGAAKQLSARQLCLFTLLVTAAYIALGLGAELALGTFRPWEAEYRFAGTMHPNGQADNCGVVCLAAAVLLSSAKRGRALLVALLVTVAVLLVLTKSRSACVSLIGAVLVFFVLRASSQVKLMVSLAGGWAAGLAVLTVELLHASKSATAALLLGRQEHIGTLTGRTELWQELMLYIESRPLLGYGYGGFWSAARIDAISSAMYWGVGSAHSAYFETVLHVGIVGLVMLCSIIAVGMFSSAERARATGNTGYGFGLALLVFGAINGIAEAGFVSPSFLTWVAGCGLAQLAFFSRNALASGFRGNRGLVPGG